ncbi:MAG: bifunctional precorrin-2 dehydrogenase/sirohydrochlorin ferrochelatase [Tannerella sp.]|jgi:siroheme synthase-like protein|nr:bifunctional precorrin-2 dehydrogenase/sirohydrochlorin ferrochelatase [Tannerella sp.]
MQTLQFLPVSIRIDGRAIVLIGGGRVALHKAAVLSRYTSTAKVVAPEFHPGFDALPFERVRKAYEPSDLDGAFLVYICTGRRELNAAVKAECERRQLLASVCDNPGECDFISPAIHREGHLTVAVSSDARDVRRSIRVRNRIRQLTEKNLLDLR